MERYINTLAVAPLVSDVASAERSWLGASLGKLLTEHLVGAGLPMMHHNAVGEAALKLNKTLPLDKDSIQAVMRELKLSMLVTGGFRLDGEQLHLSLSIASAEATPAPLTDSAPTAALALLVERMALALVKQLGFPLDGEMRRRVGLVPRPHNFEAFRQLARARAAWAGEDYALAMSLVESALALEPTLEEAGEVKIGVAQAAGDAPAVREGFQLWAELAARNGRPLDRAERLLLFGHWLVSQGTWDEAANAYREALGIYEARGHRLGEAQALDNLAGLLLRRGQPDEAVETYQRSIAVYEMLGARQDVATATYNLALGHKAQGDTQAALEAVNRALNSARSLKEKGLEAATLDQRGTLRAQRGEVQGAQGDYERALTLYEEEGDRAGLATVKDHMAGLHQQEGDLAAAEALRLEAVALFETLGDAHELAVAWANLATLYVEMGAYQQAWDYAERAHAVFTRLGSGMQPVTEQLLTDLS